MSKIFLLAAILAIMTGYAAFIDWHQRHKPEYVVCLGDSLTACGGLGGRFSDYLAEKLPTCRVINQGIGGNTLAQGRARFFHDVLRLRPKVVVIELGANDFHRKERPIEALREDLSAMTSAAKAVGIQVLIAGVFGSQRDELGKLVPKVYLEGTPEFGAAILEMERSVAREFGALHVENMQMNLNRVEHWTDPRHPSAAGNKVIAELLLPYIEQLILQP